MYTQTDFFVYSQFVCQLLLLFLYKYRSENSVGLYLLNSVRFLVKKRLPNHARDFYHVVVQCML